MRKTNATQECFQSGRFLSKQLLFQSLYTYGNPLTKKDIGKLGEAIAIEYLLKFDFLLLHHNWETKFGELDIVAMKARCLHVIEVKTRKSQFMFRYPASNAVNQKKQTKIYSLAEQYCQRHKGMLANRNCRTISFDIVSVYYERRQVPGVFEYNLEHTTSAF